jgi:hypothetical protein
MILEKEGEPWVELMAGGQLIDWSHNSEVSLNQKSRQTARYQFFQWTFDFLKDNEVLGDYHEYGCHRCRSFRMALTEARRQNLDQMKFFAFDSFCGLPAPSSNPSKELWQKGALTTDRETFMRMVVEHGIYADKVETVEGYYENTLTEALQRRFLQQERPISMATIDCDLYESAVPVFNFIDPLLQEGAVLYIDDMFAGYKGSPTRGVALAFAEYQRVSRFKFVEHLSVGWWGKSFIAYR